MGSLTYYLLSPTSIRSQLKINKMASFTVNAPVASKVAFKASAVTGQRVAVATPKAVKVAKATTTCAMNSRREAMNMIAVGASLFAASPAFAADGDFLEKPKIFSYQQQAKTNGFQEIYEARALENNTYNAKSSEAQRFALKKLDAAGTKARVAESGKRINEDVAPLIAKAFYPAAREEVRRQVGYLRFDLDNLISQAPKDTRKEAKALKLAFIADLEDLDFQLRQKNGASSSEALERTKASFAAISAAIA